MPKECQNWGFRRLARLAGCCVGWRVRLQTECLGEDALGRVTIYSGQRQATPKHVHIGRAMPQRPPWSLPGDVFFVAQPKAALASPFRPTLPPACPRVRRTAMAGWGSAGQGHSSPAVQASFPSLPNDPDLLPHLESGRRFFSSSSCLPLSHNHSFLPPPLSFSWIYNCVFLSLPFLGTQQPQPNPVPGDNPPPFSQPTNP